MLYAKQNTIAGFHLYADHILRFVEETPEAQQLLERFGYTVERLQAGRRLLEEAQAAYRDVQELQKLQKATTQALREEMRVIHRRYQVQLQAARRALGKELPRVQQYKPSNYSPWLSLVQSFYATVLRNPSFQEKLDEASIPSTELQRSLQMVEALVHKKTAQTKSHQSLRDRNQQRRQQQRAVIVWIQELRSNALFAFRDAPGLLAAMHALAPQSKIDKKKTKASDAVVAETEVSDTVAIASV
ncbi:MAG: hypothetical protein U0175_05425 [Caldilineaceae bacterium]